MQAAAGYLDQRSKAEVKQAEVVGTDEKVRTYCRPRSRSLKTLFGEVTVNRLGYSADDASSLFPLDAALNLPEDKYFQGIRREMSKPNRSRTNACAYHLLKVW
jgi:hypothetical protein